MLKFFGYGNEVKDVEVDSYGVLRTCEHCGKEIHRVDSYEFGTKDLCQSCTDELGINGIFTEYYDCKLYNSKDRVDYEPLSKEWTDQLNSDLKFYDDLYEQIISDRKKFK